MPPLKILIVEDEVIVATELEMIVADAGHSCIGSAIKAAEALQLAAETRPDLAFVDVHLSDGPTGVGTAETLMQLGAMVIYMTANPTRIPDGGASALGVISKPYAPANVRRALDYAVAVLGAGLPESRGRALHAEV